MVRWLVSAWFAVGSLGGCGSDDGGDGIDARPPDAATSTDGADAAGSADALSATFEFDLDPTTVTITAGQPDLFHLTNIRVTGIDLSGGVHYHVFLDSASNPYLLFSDATPDSPDIEIPGTTTAGVHQVVGALEDASHQELGVQASRPLTVLVP